MPFFGIFSLLFGVVVVSYPEFLAYLVGGFFIFIGLNIIAVSLIFKRPTGGNVWNIGGYEISRRRDRQ